MAQNTSPQDTNRGRFIWYELLTEDPDGASAFYPSVVGWGTTEWEGGEQPYTMWTSGQAPLAGMLRLPEEAVAQGTPSHWLPYVGTDDVDATAARALERGATILVEPRDIPTVGRFAVLRDPQGAVFAVFTPEPGSEEPAEGSGAGRFSWHELATDDHAAAFDFYSDLFGWERTEEMDMGEDGMYLMYGHGDRTYGGIYDKPRDRPEPAHWLCYISVDDIDDAAERVKGAGGGILVGPLQVPGGGSIVQCVDPQGAAFALHAPPHKAAAAGGAE